MPVDLTKYFGIVVFVEAGTTSGGQGTASHKISAKTGAPARVPVGMSDAVTKMGVFAVHPVWEGVQGKLKVPRLQPTDPGGIGAGVLPPLALWTT